MRERNIEYKVGLLMVCAVFLFAAFIFVLGNFSFRGGYTVYVLEWATGGRGKGPVTNVSIVGNRIGRGRWGAFDIRSELGHRPFVSGNVDAKTGRLLPGQSAGRTAH